jgi:DNA repair protein RadA/Sms
MSRTEGMTSDLGPKKDKRHYVCQSCGGIEVKWRGQCGECQSWGTLVEEVIGARGGKSGSSPGQITFVGLSVDGEISLQRLETSIKEFDRVCGGGLVPGSVLLLGGDPGIGKSTLLLQVSAALSQKYGVGYISGEEGIGQIQLRARRMGLEKASVELASAHNISVLMEALELRLKEGSAALHCLIIDSIQTMTCDLASGAPGTVGQIRECTQLLIQFAKKTGTIVILVGHITKDGIIAGPKLLEHMVDAVIYFEGDRGHQFRILRCVKNRFGSTHEIGVFEMSGGGLQEVSNPSALFLNHRLEDTEGSAVFAGMEGSRPVLVEIQALTTASFLASPRRAVVGWDHNRLSTVLAVLEARCRIPFSSKDVFLSVVGGLKITEPAGDLATALAVLSCLKQKAIPQGWIAFGEIGLTGEIRPVAQQDARLKEAKKLGFKTAIVPKAAGDSHAVVSRGGMELRIISNIKELVHLLDLLPDSCKVGEGHPKKKR